MGERITRSPEQSGELSGADIRKNLGNGSKTSISGYLNREETGAFFGRKNGKEAYLFHAMKVPVRRHVRIKGKVNPYDPEWEDYLKDRKNRITSANLRNRRVLELWKEQDGRCPVCSQTITAEEGWHSHHIK